MKDCLRGKRSVNLEVFIHEKKKKRSVYTCTHSQAVTRKCVAFDVEVHVMLRRTQVLWYAPLKIISKLLGIPALHLKTPTRSITRN